MNFRNMPNKERQSRCLAKPELVLSPLVRFFESPDRTRLDTGSSKECSSPSTTLVSFFDGLLTQTDGDRVSNFILISDRAQTPHEELIQKVSGRLPRNKRRGHLRRRELFRKSLSTSSIVVDDDAPVLIPAHLLKDRWSSTSPPDDLDPRWAPSPTNSTHEQQLRRPPLELSSKNRIENHSDTSPVSVVNIKEQHHAIPRAPAITRDPTPLLPRRMPSPRALGKDTVRTLPMPPPAPPLFTSSKKKKKAEDKRKKKRLIRCESDSSLICPEQTGRTIQASRPCFRVTWIQDSNKQYTRQIQPLS